MDYRARDIMNADVITVPATMDLRDLAKLFLERGITGAPVVDAGGRLVGVVSQTDLVYYNLTRGDELVVNSSFYQSARFEGHRLPRGFQVEDFNSGVVADVMTPVVHSVDESAPVEAVARMMTRNHIHRVIVRRGRRIAGIISALDVLRLHGKQAQRAARGAAKTARGAKAPRKTKTTRPARAKAVAGRRAKAAGRVGRRRKAAGSRELPRGA
jgi:CBS domain-containing protein